MHRGWSFASLTVLLCSVGACAHHTDARDVDEQFAPIECQRIAACLPQLYDLAYPEDQNDGSTKQCVADILSKAPAAGSKVEACGDDQIEKCKEDLQTFCPTLDNIDAQPPSCNGC